MHKTDFEHIQYSLPRHYNQAHNMYLSWLEWGIESTLEPEKGISRLACVHVPI